MANGDDGKKKEKILALWHKKSEKTGREYYSGILEDGRRVVAWPKRDDAFPNAPDIVVYLSDDPKPPPF